MAALRGTSCPVSSSDYHHVQAGSSSNSLGWTGWSWGRAVYWGAGVDARLGVRAGVQRGVLEALLPSSKEKGPGCPLGSEGRG